MQLNAAAYDLWVFRRGPQGVAWVHFRGLKDGLRSVQEYITGVEHPARELCLFDASTA